VRWSVVVDWWHGRGGRNLAHLHVVVYTRRGCHLCDVAWQQLEKRRKRYRFTMAAVDIDADPALVRRFDAQVPVVEINGDVRFWGRINDVLLDRLLEGESRRR